MTNSLIPVGYVTPKGQDIFPTTGPHLDVRVMKDGKYINPGTIRSLLTRLKVGEKNTPLWSQSGNEWKPSFPITSGFGARSAPAAGASTFHPAHDYGVAEKTKLAWEGPGTFTPGKGYGEIKTTGTGGEEYVIKLLHTMGGKAGGVSAQAQTQQPTTQQAGLTPGTTTYNIYMGAPATSESPVSFLKRYSQNMFDPRALFESMLPTPSNDTVSQIQNLLSSSPQYV